MSEKKVTKKTTVTKSAGQAKTTKESDNAGKLLNEACIRLFGCDVKEATKQQMYRALCSVVSGLLTDKRKKFHDKYRADDTKQVYYMSMEFLVGTSLRNNLYNLGVEEEFAKAVEKFVS